MGSATPSFARLPHPAMLSATSKPLYRPEDQVPQRGYNPMDVSDINQKNPAYKFKNLRVHERGNPNDRVYKEPQYTTIAPEEIKYKYNENYIDDIEGVHARDSHYSKALHKIPEVRTGQFFVNDITGRGAPKKEIVYEKELMMDVTDINGPRRSLEDIPKSRVRDPCNPTYDWKDAYTAGFLVNGRKEYLASRDVFNNSYILRTDDIIGHDRDVYQKKRQLGEVGTVYDSLNVDDITKVRKVRELPRDFEFNQRRETPIIGEEYTLKPGETLARSIKVYHKEIPPPEDFVAYNPYDNLKKSKIIQGPEQTFKGRTSTIYDVPYVQNPDPNEVYKKKYYDPKDIPTAGVETEALQCTKVNYCAGFLPGPAPEVYKDRKLIRVKPKEHVVIEYGKKGDYVPSQFSASHSGLGLTSVSNEQRVKDSYLMRGSNRGSTMLNSQVGRQARSNIDEDIELVRSLRL